MRSLRFFLLGMVFAGFMLLASSPLWLAGVGLTMWLTRGDLFTVLSGQSVFGLREWDGRMDARQMNVSFHTVAVTAPGEKRPRRMLLRIEVFNPDVFGGKPGSGRVRLDAWSLETAADVKQPALYTLLLPGRDARLGENGVFVVDDTGGRHSAYGLVRGQWLYDFDAHPAILTTDLGQDRVVALATAANDMPAEAVAVISIADTDQVHTRAMIVLDDPERARLLRPAFAAIRPLLVEGGDGARRIELVLPFGRVRVPLMGDSPDLRAAELPGGLSLVEMAPWGQTSIPR